MVLHSPWVLTWRGLSSHRASSYIATGDYRRATAGEGTSLHTSIPSVSVCSSPLEGVVTLVPRVLDSAVNFWVAIYADPGNTS